MFLRVLFQRRAAYPLHQFPQQNEVDIAVDELRARRVLQLFLMGAAEGLRLTHPLLFQIEIGRQP